MLGTGLIKRRLTFRFRCKPNRFPILIDFPKDRQGYAKSAGHQSRYPPVTRALVWPLEIKVRFADSSADFSPTHQKA